MYYKILRNDMKHYNMQYHEGLNTNCEKTIYDDKCGSGLFFSDEKHIISFTIYGDLIADVTLPDGELISKVDDKYKAHQIILSNIRPLWTIETLEDLIQNGADIHANNDFALRWAVRKGHLEAVKYLIEQGCNIHDKNYALRFAAENGYLETIKCLIEQGADIHADSEYALRWAAYKGHFEIVKLLVEHGANIHALNDWALQFAAENGHLETAKYLVEQGVDIHIDNDYVLRFAAYNGHFEIVKLLVEHGANIHALNDWALQWAVKNKHTKVADYLKSL